jgi:hypothetical protein
MAISGDEYRVKAANMNELAKHETDPKIQADLQRLVYAYLRLADRADRMERFTIVHPPHPVLQQQQRQNNESRQPTLAASIPTST